MQIMKPKYFALKSGLRTLNLFIFTLLLSACSLSPVKLPDIANYQLQYNDAGQGAKVSAREIIDFNQGKNKEGSIYIAPISMVSPYDGQNLFYHQNWQILTYNMSKWVSPIGQQLRELITIGLQTQISSVYFETHYLQSSMYIMKIEVLDMSQYLLPKMQKKSNDKTLARVRLFVKASIYNMNDQHMITAHYFDLSIKSTQNAVGMVCAMQLLSTELVLQLQNWVKDNINEFKLFLPKQ